MIKHLILFFMLFAAPAVFGQYLTYKDLKDILEAAEDRDDAVKFLEDKNFEEVTTADEDDKYTLYYKKIVAGQDYYINLIANTDLGVYTVAEFTWADERWGYYQSIIDLEGYELTEKRKQEGAQIFDYEGDDYDVSLSKKPEDDGTTLYKFILSSY